MTLRVSALVLLPFGLMACALAGAAPRPPADDAAGAKPVDAFAGRTGKDKLRLLHDYGGTKKSEEAVANGLKFLAAHQADDGHWSLHEFYKHAKDEKGRPVRSVGVGQGGMKNDTAGTALGLLPFLGAGYTHKTKAAKGEPDFAKVVDKALCWLVKNQTKEGDFGGGMYAHPLATMALCEAYGMTTDPALKAPAQNAIDYIVNAQHEAGGWRYAPKKPGDTSVTGWHVQALKAGQLAGLNVPAATLKGAGQFLDSVQVNDGAGYAYTGGGQETLPMTAAGLLCRQHLGWAPRQPALLRGVAKIRQTDPSRQITNLYASHYVTLLLHNQGGDDWK